MNRGYGATKVRRQQAILGLVSRERLASQDDIRRQLASLGIEATQSTISRDILEIGLARVHDVDGVRYVMPGEQRAAVHPMVTLRRLLDEFAVAFIRTSHGLLVRTPPGAAAALAEGIDRATLPGLAGTIAGDDTILLLGREGVTPSRLERILMEIMEATS